jgi:hypothetical protein
MTFRPASQVARCAYEKIVSPVPIGSGLNELPTVQVPHCPGASDAAAAASALLPAGGGLTGAGAGGGLGEGGGGLGDGGGALGGGAGLGGVGDGGLVGAGDGAGGLDGDGGVGEPAAVSSAASSDPPPQALNAMPPMLRAAARMNSRRALSNLLFISFTIKNPAEFLVVPRRSRKQSV